MAQKKAAFIMLLTLIMIFISLVLSWMAYSQKGGGGEEYPQLEKRTAELEQQVEELTASRNQMLAMLDQGGTGKNPEQNPNQPVTEQPSSQGEKMFTVTSKVYLRADATINAWIVDELPKGKKLIYLNEKKEADGFTWYKVSDSYKIWGWVSSSHVQ